MELVTSSEGTVTVVALSGRLDRDAGEDMEEQLAVLLQGGQRHLVLDLQELEQIDSAGLRLLLKLGKRLDAMDGRLVLCGMCTRVRRSFHLAGLMSLFTITLSRNEAVRELAGDENLARIADLAADLLAIGEQRSLDEHSE